MFCSEEPQLSSLQKPKQKPESQFIGGKIQICCMVRMYTQEFLPPSHLYYNSFCSRKKNLLKGMLIYSFRNNFNPLSDANRAECGNHKSAPKTP